MIFITYNDYKLCLRNATIALRKSLPLHSIMTAIISHIRQLGLKAITACYDIEANGVVIKETSKEFEGDYTMVIFPLVKQIKKSPQDIGNRLGAYMVEHSDLITDFNVIKGFLNLRMAHSVWLDALNQIKQEEQYGHQPPKNEKILVEYSSPNTNKPLHLGHIRNILLGWSIANILEAAGYEVVRTQIINDRGVAICKSMVAWKLYAKGATPQSTKTKGDLFVGNYYVLFDKKFKEEYALWQKTDEAKQILERQANGLDSDLFFADYKNTYFNSYSHLGSMTRTMLLDWENKDPEVMALWSMMRDWVLAGFSETFEALGVYIDKDYFESDTYLMGRDIIAEGLAENVFYKKADNSVWIDLEAQGLGQKIVLRSDGTSVYITQDLGTAEWRYKDFGMDSIIYVVGNEQDYHFQVLFETLKLLKKPYADKLYHLSYGMVDLPSGKMKSREGTVVDADDLIHEVIAEAAASTSSRGVLEDLSDDEIQQINRKIGLAALKFFILKVQAKKRMIFDPKESVDMQGQTGPYIQNAYVRIRSIQRKAATMDISQGSQYTDLNVLEIQLIRILLNFPDLIQSAAKNHEPSEIAQYAYQLAKDYHRYYHEVKILSDPDPAAVRFRLSLSEEVGHVLKSAFKLLGIDMPNRM